MNTSPKVTIGLPVYNGQKYLEQAIDSILSQTYRNFILIISDNASTDRTQQICERYQKADPRVEYHRYDKNQGAAWNFNNCARLATTEYFKWACYDDMIEPDMLERCVAALDEDTEIVLAYPGARVIDDAGNTIGIWYDEFDCRAPEPHRRLAHYWSHKSRNEAQYGVWRREPLLQSNLMGTIPFSDQVLMAEMMLRGFFHEVKAPLFLKRFHPGISTEAYDMYRLAAFMDPKRQNRPSLLRLERLLEFLRAIDRVKLSPYERSACYLTMLRLALLPTNWRRMLQDIIMFARIRSRRQSTSAVKQ